MGRAANMSPLGLYQWDNTLFDLLVIPSQLDKNTLIDNLLAETAELEVLYPNPVVMKALIGVWSDKNKDIWDRLYATTQYEYNPIENYNRYEEGSEDGGGSTTHSGSDSRTEGIMHGGSDATTRQRAEGGTEGEQSTLQVSLGGSDSEQTSSQVTQSGTDSTTVTDTKGGWIAGFDSTPSATDDGLVKKTRDQDDATTSTTYGKTESETGHKTTNFGKTENDAGYKTTNFGKTESENESISYGKTENITENKTYGEKVTSTSEGSHELHAHGNIGVTTTQKLIREQRDIEKFNLYDIIIEEFKMRFCILVY